jgi:exopolysaccharide production protein ExoZ
VNKDLNRTIQGIQVLRAVAATMVVIHHARHAVPGATSAWISWGSSGVDIFFVISGYVMAYTTQQIAGVDMRDRASEAFLFLRKRVARIVPLYWLFILWTGRQDLLNLDILRDLAFIPHWSEAYPTELYPVLTQGWTLNYEMFFYALFAVAMMFGPRRIFALLIALVAIPLFALTFRSGQLDAAGTFYSNQIILEFGFGVILQQAVWKWNLPEWSCISFVGLLLVGFALLSFGSDTSPVRAITWGLPAVLIVWAGLKAFDGWLSFRPLELLGEASYAIYLCHWTSFALLKPLAAAAHPSDANALMILLILIGVSAGVFVHLTAEQWVTRGAKVLLGLRSTSKSAIQPASRLIRVESRTEV